MKNKGPNQGSNPLAPFVPRLFNTRDLIPVIKLSHQTQLNYMADPSRRHRMPPNAFKRPGGREWLWHEEDVLTWLELGKRAETPAPAPPPSPRRGPGRPPGSLNKKRRIEQIEAAKAQLRQGGA